VLGAASAIFLGADAGGVTENTYWLVLRADNHGEGGIMALLALARHAVVKRPSGCARVALAGMVALRCSTATPC